MKSHRNRGCEYLNVVAIEPQRFNVRVVFGARGQQQLPAGLGQLVVRQVDVLHAKSCQSTGAQGAVCRHLELVIGLQHERDALPRLIRQLVVREVERCQQALVIFQRSE